MDHPHRRCILRTLSAPRDLPLTLRELATLCGLSPSGMRHHCEMLRARGDLTWTPRTARSLRLTAQGRANGAAAQR
jgi:predicted ArsR family transcriptional regulator